MSKYILGQIFLDRGEIEEAYKCRSLGMFGSMSSEGEWEEFARSKTRKVFAILVGIPMGIIVATASVAWAVLTAPLKIFARAVKECGEVYLLTSNAFVLYKEGKKEASE